MSPLIVDTRDTRNRRGFPPDGPAKCESCDLGERVGFLSSGGGGGVTGRRGISKHTEERRICRVGRATNIWRLECELLPRNSETTPRREDRFQNGLGELVTALRVMELRMLRMHTYACSM